MPELPEVETIVGDLAPLIVGARIIRVRIRDPLLVSFPSRTGFNRRLTGGIIQGISRRGKYIEIKLEQGLMWLVHLRMTGRLQAGQTIEERHRRGRFTLDNGVILHYFDLRRFGQMWAFWPGEEGNLGGYCRLGPEPLSPKFDGSWLATEFAHRKAPVKSLLLDQGIVAGLGNIYTDEALFRAGIDPGRGGCSLTASDCQNLAEAIKGVLAQAIGGRGTTFRDYRSGRGTAGEYQRQLRVYGRAGQPCSCCGRVLEKIRLGGRGTVYCPHCQD